MSMAGARPSTPPRSLRKTTRVYWSDRIFATRWGSVGFLRPLTTGPDLWDAGIKNAKVTLVYQHELPNLPGKRIKRVLVARAAARRSGLRSIGCLGCTACRTVYLCPKRQACRALRQVRVLSALSDGDHGCAGWCAADDKRLLALLGIARRTAAAGEYACRELTEEILSRSRLGGEIRTAAVRALGDTALLWDRNSRLAGFGVCHWAWRAKPGEGCCFAKFAAVRPGPGAEERFGRLLDGCAMLAREAGMANVLAGSISRERKPTARCWRAASGQ
jgi:hypothetical protein